MQWMTEETGWLMDENICSTAPGELLRLGASLAAAAPKCAVGWAEGSGFAAACGALVCGAAAAAGGSVLRVPDCVPGELAAAAGAADCGILLHCGAVRAQVLGAGLLPLGVPLPDAPPRWQYRTEYGQITEGGEFRRLYPERLRQLLPENPPCKAEINTSSPRLKTLLSGLFSGGRGETVTVQLSADGRRASLYSDRSGWIFCERLLLMAAQRRLERGEPTALPFWLPTAAERMAADLGGHILRYGAGADADARALAAAQGFTLDGAVLAAEIMQGLAEGRTLREWSAALPEFHTVRRVLHADTDALLRCGDVLPVMRTAAGFRGTDTRGTVWLRPSLSGRSLTMLVESADMESARELAGDLAARIADVSPMDQ